MREKKIQFNPTSTKIDNKIFKIKILDPNYRFLGF